MLQIKTYLAPDRFGGTGLFAEEDIAAGQVIWRYDPATTSYIPAAKYQALPEARKAEIVRHIYPVYLPDETPPLIGLMLNTDNTSYTNHSDQPNSGHTERDPDINIALRPIQKGEEITCNYHEFDPQNAIAKMGISTCKDFLLANPVRIKNGQ